MSSFYAKYYSPHGHVGPLMEQENILTYSHDIHPAILLVKRTLLCSVHSRLVT